jgi:hypothetical protein
MTPNDTVIDHDCFVIGSGPSLTGFDFSKLPPAVRIGANKGAWIANCDTLVTLDRHFPRKCRAEIEAFEGEIIIAAIKGEPRLIENATYVERERGDGFSKEGALRGYDSGFAALNLAWQRGYKRIALLGFDFKWDGRKTHFHEGYQNQNSKTPQMLERWALAFDRVAHIVDATNYVGPSGSNVTAFPTRPLEDLQ